MKSNATCPINLLIVVSFFQLLFVSSSAQLTPISLNTLGFNQDLIAEGAAGPNVSTLTSSTIGYNYILYDVTFKTNHPVITAGGLPANGIIINGSDTWQLQPYTGNNALFFPVQPVVTSASLSLNTPAQYSKVSLLATSVNGPIIVDIALVFSDLTSTTYSSIAIKDWILQTPFVIQGIGAILREDPVAAQEGTPDDPRFYQVDLNLSPADQLKTVASINIMNSDVTNSITVAFFAASGIPVLSLPITFSSLSAQYQSSEKKIVLYWEAETSLNSSGFEVERSADAAAFRSIATVNSNKIMGISNYSYIDNNLQNRQSWFYRIKETLPGGTINYSKILNVKISPTASLRIIQTAGNIRLLTSLPDKTFNYTIIDSYGKQLKSGTAYSANQFAIDVHSLPAGSYFLNVLNHAEIKSLKFVRN